MKRAWQRGLYAVTDPDLIAPDDLVAWVSAAITGGAVLIQYRDKCAGDLQRMARARALLTVCRERQVPLIINDDVALATTIGADGVHLGRNDAVLGDARRCLGPDAIIGVSCYNDVPRAIAAAEAGADYVAFGRFFPSRTKPQARQADVETLRRAKQYLPIPVAAIGGITADNGGELIAAGVDLLAVIHGVFGQTDSTAAARSITELFDTAGDNRRREAFGV